MSYTITISYAPVAASGNGKSASICAIFEPNNAAADMSVFDDTYYDTNVDGWGEATPLTEFVKSLTAHPGLIAAVRKAIRDGSYVIAEASEEDALYLDEVKDTFKDEGITITIAKNEESTADNTEEDTQENNG